MRPLRSIAAIAVLCAALMAVQPSTAHAPRSEDYVGSCEPLTCGVCRSSSVPVNIGKVCFDIAAGQEYVDIDSTDIVTGKAGMFYIFTNSAGTCLQRTPDDLGCETANFICGGVNNLSVPGGAKGLHIYIGSNLGLVACTVNMGSDVVGWSTAGTITAHFTSTIGGN